MMRVLVTGASGFLGGALTRRLFADGRSCRVAVRRLGGSWPAGVEVDVIPGLDSQTDWRKAVEGVGTVVHCAARVHVMKEQSASPLDDFRRINVHGTLHLARQAVAAGVKRFVLISSIGVNGSETSDQPFCADGAVSPATPYAISKWECEQELLALGRNSGLEVVIIRPPMIYGPGAPGNFARLLRLIDLQLPLPFGGLKNLRSFAALDNVVDLIVLCIDHPAAPNQVFLVSDGEDLSTTDFIRHIAKARGRSVLLLPIPEKWLETLAGMAGKRQQLRKLTGSLQIDIEKTITMLSWKPVVSVVEAMKDVTRHQ